MTPELKKYRRQRQWRIIRNHMGEALLFAFPMLLAAGAFLYAFFSIVLYLWAGITPAKMWGL